MHDAWQVLARHCYRHPGVCVWNCAAPAARLVPSFTSVAYLSALVGDDIAACQSVRLSVSAQMWLSMVVSSHCLLFTRRTPSLRHMGVWTAAWQLTLSWPLQLLAYYL